MQLTVRDAARLLTVSEKTVYRWIKQGKLPAYQINDQFRFSRSELLEWATAKRINVSPEIFAEMDGGGQAMPTLVEALQRGGIHLRGFPYLGFQNFRHRCRDLLGVPVMVGDEDD